jgi:uncharacterized protein (TIGR03546 family)
MDSESIGKEAFAMVNYIFKLIKVLQSDVHPGQISLGFALGMIPGLTPVSSPHNLLVLLALLFLRANLSAAVVSWVFFSVLAYGLDPLFNRLGLFLLTGIGSLQGFWTSLYNAPLVPYTRFNNSVVLGSLVFSLLAFYPVYRGGCLMVLKYRETFLERLNRWRVVQIIKASSLYKWYARYSALKG